MKTLLLALALLSQVVLADSTLGGGAVPWPWPWAEECQINYQDLRGMWIMDAEAGESFILIESEWSSEKKSQYVEIELVNGDMKVYATGAVYVDRRERVIRVPLTNSLGEQHSVLELRIYHRNHLNTCQSRDLVPIVTLKVQRGTKAHNSHYILKPRGPNSPEQEP